MDLVKQMNMINDEQLAYLHRRMTSATGPGSLQGDDLVDCLQGTLDDKARAHVLAQVGASQASADVARMLNELALDSDRLAADVGALLATEAPAVAHLHTARARVARGRRTARIGAGWLSVAACLVAVIGVWNMDRSGESHLADSLLAQPTPVLGDVIFASNDFASNDRIFSGGSDTSRAPAVEDRLFSSRFAGS